MLLGAVGVQWYLVNFQSQGVRLIWIIVGREVYYACSRCGLGLKFGYFFSYVISLFFLPLIGRRPDIDCNIVSKGP